MILNFMWFLPSIGRVMHYWSDLYKEKIVHPEDAAFINSLRITCFGHANTDIFGDDETGWYTPEQLSNYFIDRGLSKDRCVIIDLFGCQTGLDLIDKESYAKRFTRHLITKGYDKIRVNAFNPHDVKLDYNYRSYVRLQATYPGFSLSLLENGKDDAKGCLWVINYLIYSETTTHDLDIRKIFDINENHQVTKESLELNDQLNARQRIAGLLLNSHIAKLKLEILKAKNPLCHFFYDANNINIKKQQLRFLKHLKFSIIATPDFIDLKSDVAHAPELIASIKATLEEILRSANFHDTQRLEELYLPLVTNAQNNFFGTSEANTQYYQCANP